MSQEMMKRIGAILIGLGLMIAHPAVAAEADEPESEAPHMMEEQNNQTQMGDQSMESIKAYQEIFIKHTQITANCELDPVCIYEEAKKVVATTDNDLIKTFFTEMVMEFEDNKQAILDMEKKCAVPELRQTRKAIASCFPLLLESFDKQDEDKALEQKLNLCLADKLKSQADQDNPFAMGALMDVYENLGRQQDYDDLSKKLDALKGSDLHNLYQSCQEPK